MTINILSIKCLARASTTGDTLQNTFVSNFAKVGALDFSGNTREGAAKSLLGRSIDHLALFEKPVSKKEGNQKKKTQNKERLRKNRITIYMITYSDRGGIGRPDKEDDLGALSRVSGVVLKVIDSVATVVLREIA